MLCYVHWAISVIDITFIRFPVVGSTILGQAERLIVSPSIPQVVGSNGLLVYRVVQIQEVLEIGRVYLSVPRTL
jgi:hypothetical protein